MAEKEASVVRKPEDESTRPPNPLSSIISKVTEVLNFRFPPPPAKNDAVNFETPRIESGDAVFRGGAAAEELKPPTVSFPDARTTTVDPVKLETEEVARDTNPVVLWQVYAIGGFFFLKWVLARWNARRANKKSSNEDSRPPPPASPPAEAND